MRQLFILLAGLLISADLLAQFKGGCGAVAPSNYKHHLSQEQRAVSNPAHTADRSGIQWVPVWYHIVTRYDGTGAANLKDVFISHCDLNAAYNPFNIGFFIAGIDTVMDGQLWEYQTVNPFSVFTLNNVEDVCNIYVNGTLADLCGFATFPHTAPKGGGIFLNKGCIGEGTKTLPHEMGHFFNLLHTFHSADGIEYVDGSNCATAGDGFCDTPADFLDDRTPCPYTGNQTDPHGDLYRTVIDPTLYMSYFTDDCVNRFSQQEKDEIVLALEDERPELLNHWVPDTRLLDTAVFLNPVHGDVMFNSAYPFFRWNTIPGANYYLLHVESITPPVKVVVDTLLTDTTFVGAALKTSNKYKYFVYGITHSNTCPNNFTNRDFITPLTKATIKVRPSGCNSEAEGSIKVTPAFGAAPYAFAWSTGDTTQNLSGLSPGIYTLTMTDNNNHTLTSTVQIVDSPQIYITVVPIGTDLNAYASGGASPYTFEWSNGSHQSVNSNVAYGSYTVTATDNNGCTNSKSFIFSSIKSAPETKASLKIFPNPVAAGEVLNLQIELNERLSGTISLTSITGQTIHQLKKELTPGVNNLQMDIDQLPSGLYFVQLRSDKVLRTEKVSIIR